MSHWDRSFPLLDPGEKLLLATKWKISGLSFTWTSEINENCSRTGCIPLFSFFNFYHWIMPTFLSEEGTHQIKMKDANLLAMGAKPSFPESVQGMTRGGKWMRSRWQEIHPRGTMDISAVTHQRKVWKRWHFYGILFYCAEHFFLVSYILASLGNIFLKGKRHVPYVPIYSSRGTESWQEPSWTLPGLNLSQQRKYQSYARRITKMKAQGSPFSQHRKTGMPTCCAALLITCSFWTLAHSSSDVAFASVSSVMDYVTLHEPKVTSYTSAKNSQEFNFFLIPFHSPLQGRTKPLTWRHPTSDSPLLQTVTREKKPHNSNPLASLASLALVSSRSPWIV